MSGPGECAPAFPTLVIIRGNSGSGKSTAAREVRRRYGRGCALVEQDQLRRVVLREHDIAAAEPVAPGFIAAVARAALDSGYHVVLEGILHAARYGTVLRRLAADHRGTVAVYYLDVPFAETVRRHRERPEAGFTADDMRGWYTEHDVLGIPGEHIIGEESSLDRTVTTILHSSGLAYASALTPCPTRCPACSRRGGEMTTR
ncbi:kinase [Actinoplanes sp. CA-030573]|uniref:kinase n=1 Tax=Actinoplanes sp. CA-030573 TaxID=3239898 RepID=UPI003D8FC37C